MTYPDYIHEKAREMRARKMTLTQIAERLAIPKTTIWYWIKDMPAPPLAKVDTPRRAAARRKGNLMMQLKFSRAREAAYVQGTGEFESFCAKPGFRDFICMYIGEGYKKNRNAVAIGNSDVRVVQLGNMWIRRLGRNKIAYGLQYHADQNPDELIEFWSSSLGVAPTEIRLQRKSNSGQLSGRNWRSEWGVLTVSTGDTLLRSRMQAWMDLVREDWLCSTGGV